MKLAYLMAVGAVDARFREAVRWSVTSLRRWGRFDGDVIVVTDAEGERLGEALAGQARVVQVEADRLCDPRHFRRDRERYQMARLLLPELVDLAPYQHVMYLDADILAVREVSPLFEGVAEFRYSREFQPMSFPGFNASLNEAELAEARWRRGINSGVFVAPADYLPECLARWRAELDRSPGGGCYDQPVLNAMILREQIRARPLPALSVAYPIYPSFPEHFRPETCLLHYCGPPQAKFRRMRLHFEALEQGRPLQLHFVLDEPEEVEDVRPGAAQPSAGARGTGLRIAFDRLGAEIESDGLVNGHLARELEGRGHRVAPLGAGQDARPDIVVHSDFDRDLAHFTPGPGSEGLPHVAIRPWDFGPYPRAWTECINRHYAQLWVHSEWVHRNARASGIEAERLRLVPLGIDPGIFRPVGDLLPLPTEKGFRFLFVGGAVARKGIEILIEAYCSEFAPDEDVCLVIKDHSANRFYRDELYRHEIRRRAANPSCPEILHLDEHLSPERLGALYRACQVGVWPYRAEGFLLPALEAMACGTPTMLPEIGPTSDFACARSSFLLPTLRIELPTRHRMRTRIGSEVELEGIDLLEVRPRDLARALRRAFETSPLELREKGLESAAVALGRFTWRHSVDRIEACLRELVDKPGTSPRA